MEDLNKLMIEQLRDAYSAERQGLRSMSRLAKKASAPSLKEALQTHAEETEAQVERLEKGLEMLGGKPGRKVCEGMRGIIEEGQQELEDHDKGPLLDTLIVAMQQRVEHYEIASYGTTASLAKALGEEKVGQILGEILEEEKQTDLKLTQVTEQHIMAEALGGGGSESAEKVASSKRRAAT